MERRERGEDEGGEQRVKSEHGKSGEAVSLNPGLLISGNRHSDVVKQFFSS